MNFKSTLLSRKNIKYLLLVCLFGLCLASSTTGIAIAQDNSETEISSDDEFGDFDEFEEFDEAEEKTSATTGCTPDSATCASKCGSFEDRQNQYLKKALNWTWGILGFTLIAGFLVRIKPLRNIRGLFLLGSIAILGFYKGACPCPISSFSNLILAGIGVDIHWQHLIWFLGLIPITYLLGKVWCGWVCHLGALQEIMFIPGRLKIFKSNKAQIIMKSLRWVLFITLIVQLIITRTYIFDKYDPFRVAFNLISINLTSWILLGLLIATSLFIYRPFCRAACPIGLVLGWIGKIPGASILGVKGECRSCKVCSNSCKIDAIHRLEKSSVLDNKECIACGDCLDSCTQHGLGFVRKGKEYKTKVQLERAKAD